MPALITSATATQALLPAARPSLFSRAFPFRLLHERLKEKPALKSEGGRQEAGGCEALSGAMHNLHAELYLFVSASAFIFYFFLLKFLIRLTLGISQSRCTISLHSGWISRYVV